MSYKPSSKAQQEREDELVDLVSFCLTRREWYDRWAPVINAKWMEGARLPRKLCEAFGHFYRETDNTEVLFSEFIPWARMAHKFSDPEIERLEPNIKRYEQMRQDGLGPDDKLANRLEMEAQAIGMSKIVKDYREGKDIDMLHEIRRLNQEMEERMRNGEVDGIELDIDELLEVDRDNAGYSFRLHCLNEAIKKVLHGTFIIVAARPDQGKSSFIASEVTYMASQIKPTADDPRPPRILWLNNEGRGQELVKRLYQAALRATTADLAAKARGGTLQQEYRDRVGNCEVEVIDIHGWSTSQLDKLFKDKKPHIVVFDMLDNVTYSGGVHDGGNRTDQILEEKYKWARDACVIHNFVGIATSQISNDGDGMEFPYMSMLKDSKTGKQGACDIIIMIGSKNDGSDYRYISTPKNKRPQDGKRDPRAEVMFDRLRSRYYVPGVY